MNVLNKVHSMPQNLRDDKTTLNAKFGGVVQMSTREWCAVPGNPRQRDTEQHAKSAKHLKINDDSHCRVSMAVLPNGSRIKLDGHTRAHLWETGKLLPPPVLFVDVWKCPTEQDVKELYNRFDNKAAVETAADQLFGGVREANVSFKSELLGRNRYTSALKNAHMLASGKINNHHGELNPYTLVDAWKIELLLLDDCVPTSARFPSGVISAALMSFRKHGVDAADFWIKYANGEGSKIDGETDAVQALEEAVLRLRQKNAFAGASNTNRSVGLALSAFDGHRLGKRYGAKPKTLSQMSSVVIKNWVDDASVDQD